MAVAEYVDVPEDKIMVASENDLATLPDGIPYGTIAIVAGEGSKWQLGFDGTWVEMNA